MVVYRLDEYQRIRQCQGIGTRYIRVRYMRHNLYPTALPVRVVHLYAIGRSNR